MLIHVYFNTRSRHGELPWLVKIGDSEPQLAEEVRIMRMAWSDFDKDRTSAKGVIEMNVPEGYQPLWNGNSVTFV